MYTWCIDRYSVAPERLGADLVLSVELQRLLGELRHGQVILVRQPPRPVVPLEALPVGVRELPCLLQTWCVREI